MRSKRAAPRLQGTKKKQTRPPEFKRKLLMTVCPSVHFETCMVVVILHARKVIPQRLAASSPPSPARWVLPVPDPFTPPPRPSRPRPQPRRSQAPPPPSWDLSAEFGPLRPSLPLLGPLPPNLQKGLTALQRPQPPPPGTGSCVQTPPAPPPAWIAAVPSPRHWLVAAGFSLTSPHHPSSPRFAVSLHLLPPPLSSPATLPPSSRGSAVFYPHARQRPSSGASPPPRPETPNTLLTDFAISAAAAVSTTACCAQTSAPLSPQCAVGRADRARLRRTQTTLLHTQALGSVLRCPAAAPEPPRSPRAAAAGA